MICSRHTMKRKLFILAFVLSVTSNSLAAAWPYIAGDGGCESTCCRTVHHSEDLASLSEPMSGVRCPMRCEHPAENQGVPESPLLRTERDTKVVAQVAPGIQAVCSTLDGRPLHSTARVAFASTPIYLRTGTLLI
jgi:hypothetical protein